MKCPQCGSSHKIKEGMKCSSCSYQFALNPKEEPYLSDKAFQAVVEKISGPEELYYTYNQLFSRVYRAAKSRPGAKASRIVECLIMGVVLIIVANLLRGVALDLVGSRWSYIVMALVVAAGTAGIVLYGRRPLKVSHESVAKAIKAYRRLHPLEKLADGTKLKGAEPKTFDREILKYAPERMLIVERDDMADMLLLNHYAMDQKTLVVSAQKYPERAFQAFRHFVSKRPDIPISVIHDASSEGLALRERLIADKSWGLEGKEVSDLGLFPADVDRLKQPLWHPSVLAGGKALSAPPPGKSADEYIRQGYRMPVDVAPPWAMMGVIGLAMVAGAALLSEELLAEQAKQAVPGSSTWGGGYG